MLESFHHNNTNYGCVDEGALLRALKTLKCRSFCFAKKQNDNLVHLTLTLRLLLGVKFHFVVDLEDCMGATFSLLVNLQKSHVQFPSRFKRRRIT